MSAEPRTLKTEAEEGLARHYRAVRGSLPGSPQVAARRDASFAAFERQGLPHRRVEAWKYTDLRASMKSAAAIAPAPSLETAARMLMAFDTFGALDRHRLVIVDGHFQEELSNREALRAEGVEVATLKELLTADAPESPALLEAAGPAADDPLVALNAAFASDGVVIQVPADRAPSRPIEIVHVTVDGGAVAWFARSSVKVGRGASAKLLISHVGPEGVAYQANSFVGFDADEGADMSIVDLQAEGGAAQHVATFAARLSAGAALRHVAVTSGASLSRLQAFAVLDGEVAHLTAAGANMLAGEQHGDIAWRIDHRAPGATSRVLYKNAAGGTAFGAFQGLILVRPEAQQTDGQMMTRTLLLSPEAQFAAKPELEIYADDVKCGHGATIGQVDEDALFYLMARGIARAEAEALLVRAFLAEAAVAIGDEAIADAVEGVVSAWLDRRTL